MLQDALSAGFANPELLEENEDFARLRGSAGYAAILAAARAAAERRGRMSPADLASVGPSPAAAP